MTTAYDWIDQALTTIHKAHWHRSVRTIESPPGPEIVVEGQRLINFASNDYLGLAAHPQVQAAAIAAVQAYGTGATGSRLVTGHRPLHRQLERAIAQLKQTEDALVFSSGYLANLGAVSALVGQRDLILSDQYNHSSLNQGAILSGATVLTYAHGNTLDLAQQLAQHRASHRRCLILSDSVFSMDGDLAPLPQLVALAAQFDCMLLLDEAHATGVMGATGAGCVEHFGCTGQPIVQVGTLSKALGSLGGFVAASAQVIDFLRNRAASWIYTTGLSPADTAAALAAIALMQAEPQRRQALWQNIHTLQPQRLPPDAVSAPARSPSASGPKLATDLQYLPSESAILCLPLPSAAIALEVSQFLRTEGLFIPAIRPPTVPTSRLRLALMATHQPQQLEHLLQALIRCRPKFGTLS